MCKKAPGLSGARGSSMREVDKMTHCKASRSRGLAMQLRFSLPPLTCMLRCTGPAGDDTAYRMAAAAVVRRDLPGAPPSSGGATSWDQRAKEPNSFTWEEGGREEGGRELTGRRGYLGAFLGVISDGFKTVRTPKGTKEGILSCARTHILIWIPSSSVLSLP